MRILSIFGTRPEAIKMAPLVRTLAGAPEIASLVCVTGQHREMLDPVLRLFDIRPDFDLGLMAHNQGLNGLAAGALSGLDAVLAQVRPDRVLVHGDTTTAMAAALAAFHRRIPVGHVEAGLRTYDLAQPFPEEMNRRVVDLVSDLLFAPTARAGANLAAERLAGRVLVTGNTVIDALEATQVRLAAEPELASALDRALPALDPRKRILLVTGHRRENFGDGFRSICAALAEIARRRDVEIVYPVHLNPNVRGPVTEELAGRANIHLVPPLDYLPFQRLLQRAHLVLTDSGGVQEEAPALGKPVLVMREVTERPEAVEAGTVELVGTSRAAIVAAVTRLLDDPDAYAAYAGRINPYGDGQACRRILDGLCGRPVDEFAPLPFPPAAPAPRRTAGLDAMLVRD
ncbi:UDP-N-acetylglucosamine 2-epimerase (non-hydrolyzing) [Xanthobacter autotrophicus]|uniref:non-hydrolyzing UDP-N-acetylglucosamine 2-epimerase n=1 Tax=Xanthobacter TaxID=279 RepID=UPI0024AA2DE6|nr:UDP-N-acetylglucosamine 2-epimerase (non-hydrolyzing) [Xanthobacter autotrophicus]MDI4666235.1 UDP-N-acetylglucosamine 2-epimerase (non-hydrolyzing) [Xanthobacter autotrophicus]